MITDLVCGFGLLGAYLFVVLAIAAFIHLGADPDEDEVAPAAVVAAPAPAGEVDLLADQPVDVLTQDAVDRRFYALTGRGGPRREWWA